MDVNDLLNLPTDLPVPVDDGACDHLLGMAWPAIGLPATDGSIVRLDDRTAPPSVVFAYPRTGRPGVDMPGGIDNWNAIPGARGCTPQACGYRDHHAELVALGVRVFGLSTQDTAYQRELVERVGLPYPILSDERLRLTEALRLPTFEVAGLTLLRRHTLIVRAGRIEHVRYPVFPSDTDAAETIAWLRAHGTAGGS